RWNDARSRSPGGPVAQVARAACQRPAVVRRLGPRVLLLQARDLGLDVSEPFRCNQVRMRRDWPLRQLFERVLAVPFLDESPTHGRAIDSCAAAAVAAHPCGGTTVRTIWESRPQNAIASYRRGSRQEPFREKKVHSHSAPVRVPSCCRSQPREEKMRKTPTPALAGC